jgi:long-chain acyl-CoA synthetase
MPITSALSSIARANPRAPAITADDLTLDYAAFERQVRQIAGALRQRHNLLPGARVALFMENCGPYLPLLFGCWRAGLVAVPVNNKLHPKEFAWIVADSGASLCIVSAALADTLSDVAADLPRVITLGSREHRQLTGHDNEIAESPFSPEQDAWLFYTSGTTGRPKGARLTHRNLLFACHAYYADIDSLDTRDAMLHAAPLTHGSGLYGLAHIIKGSHQIIHSGFDAAAVLDALDRYDNVSMFAAPTMITRLTSHLHAAKGAPGLKCMIYGGAPMYLADLQTALSRFGPRLYQLYGQGESPMTITGVSKAMHADTTHPEFLKRLASVGCARTGAAVKIVDDQGRSLPDGEIGEVVTRSDCVMAGYLNNPDANTKAIRDGWLWTGDVGSRAADGYITLMDRSKDMIISGGSNIYPREIEEVLLTHAIVEECAVVSRPHADWGEEVVAFIVATPGAAVPNAEQLDALCRANIARFKRPKEYRVVETLPKNNYGKILKTELRASLLAEPNNDTAR